MAVNARRKHRKLPDPGWRSTTSTFCGKGTLTACNRTTTASRNCNCCYLYLSFVPSCLLPPRCSEMLVPHLHQADRPRAIFVSEARNHVPHISASTMPPAYQVSALINTHIQSSGGPTTEERWVSATANNLIRLQAAGDVQDVLPLTFRTASNQIVRSRPSSPPLRALQSFRLAATIRYAVRGFHSVSARVIESEVNLRYMHPPCVF